MSVEIKSQIAGYVSRCQFILHSIEQLKAKSAQTKALGLLGRSSLSTQIRRVAKMVADSEYESNLRQYNGQFEVLFEEVRSFLSGVSIERRGLSSKGNSHVILRRLASIRSLSKLDSKVRKLLSILYTLSEEPLLYTKDIRKQENAQKVRRKESAYLILNELEKKLRLLIESELSKMTKDWWKQRIPKDVRENAEYRKSKNESPWPWHDRTNDPLISYLDFNDYVRVISRRDNWKDVFQKIFIDNELVSAKLRELDPIRKMVAHNRDLLDTDFVRLELHANDLLIAIQKYRA